MGIRISACRLLTYVDTAFPHRLGEGGAEGGRRLAEFAGMHVYAHTATVDLACPQLDDHKRLQWNGGIVGSLPRACKACMASGKPPPGG